MLPTQKPAVGPVMFVPSGMADGFAELRGGKRVLLAIATAKEARPALADALDRAGIREHEPIDGPWREIELTPLASLVVTGIGKANAAGAVARVLDASRHACVLSLGIAGSLPGSGLALGEIVHASPCVFADEGVRTPERFVELHDLGFPLGSFAGAAVPTDPRWRAALLRALGGREGPIATVSACSGADAQAEEIARRTGCIAEAMEGAAVALVAHRLGVPCAEVRAISNTTGDRAGQRWEIGRALQTLAGVIGFLSARGV